MGDDSHQGRLIGCIFLACEVDTKQQQEMNWRSELSGRKEVTAHRAVNVSAHVDNT